MVFLNELRSVLDCSSNSVDVGPHPDSRLGKNIITHVLTVVNSECRSNTCI